jgi:periplasmic protein TonB
MKCLFPLLMSTLSLAAQTPDDRTFIVQKPPASIVTETPVVEGNTKVFTFVGEEPQYPGGEQELLRFIQKNIRYTAVKDSFLSGKIIVKFIVNEDGSLSDATIVRGLNPSLDKEALRVANLLPKFLPGRQQGKAVKVYFNLPIIFN